MRCFIVGDYINAISLIKSIWSLHPSEVESIICFNTSGINLLPFLFPTVESVDLTKDAPGRFRAYVENNPYSGITKVLLTNEQLHEELFDNKGWYTSKGLEYNIGNLDPDYILEKNTFLSALEENNIAKVPLSFELTDSVQFPVILKAKSSFSGAVKYKVKRIFQNQEELDQFIKGSSHDITQYYLLQELLSTDPSHNVSIAGWYDPSEIQVIQTQKILQHPKMMGTGDVCKIMKLDSALLDTTQKVCDHFQYEGPFELEFIMGHDGSYRVLEFNPRFWMQHGLMNANTGESLTARALGIDPKVDLKKFQYWMNPLFVVPKSLTLDLKYLPYLFKKKTFWPITLEETIKALPVILRNKISENTR